MKKTPFLFIETPRAGTKNYRHIVPMGCWMKRKLIYSLSKKAHATQEGKGFLAVGQNNIVQQVSTQRQAPELLVLAGIDTQRLNRVEKQHLLGALQALLPHVARLVTATIDWNQEGEDLLVQREELLEWFNDRFLSIQEKVYEEPNRLLQMGIVASIVLALLAYYGYSSHQKKQEEKTTQAALQKKESEDHQIDNILSKCELDTAGLKAARERLTGNEMAIFVEVADKSSFSINTLITGDKNGVEELFKGLGIQLPESLGHAELKNWMACNSAIHAFVDEKPFCSPVMDGTVATSLQKKIAEHRADPYRKSFYEGIYIGSGGDADSCYRKDIKDLEFLKGCYKKVFSRKKIKIETSETEFFWVKVGRLIDDCKKIEER